MAHRIYIGTIVIPPKGCWEYLTPDKEYTVKEVFSSDNTFVIIDDEGAEIICRKIECPHLRHQNWTVKPQQK